MIFSCDTTKVQKGNANVPTSMSLAARPTIKIFVVVRNLVLETNAAITDPFPSTVKGISSA